MQINENLDNLIEENEHMGPQSGNHLLMEIEDILHLPGIPSV